MVELWFEAIQKKNINLSVLCISLDEESVRAKFTVNCFMNKFGENL